jgi:hypothetical protein
MEKLLSEGSQEEVGLNNEELHEFISYLGVKENDAKFYYRDYIFNSL